MFGKFLRNLDGFRSLPKELTESSATGGWMTICAYSIMTILFLCEIQAYLSPKTITSIKMDQHQAQLMEIHFDITMHKLPCSSTDVIVWDTFRENPLPIHSKSVTKTNIDFTGTHLGVHEEEDNSPQYLVHHDENHPEYDKDWDHTSDQFKKMRFQDVIRYHDFTFMNFYADWCVHCRQFAPEWNKTEVAADKMVYKDGDGNKVITKLLRINCVDFPQVCREQGIRWYPSIRLYKRDGSFTPYSGDRKFQPLLDYLQHAIENSHHIVNKDPEVHDKGCKIEGAIRTLRVPGEFHIQAMDKAVDLEPSMTNVTHTVNSLIFLDNGDEFIGFLEKFEHLVPQDVLSSAQPFLGKTFIAEEHHDAPQHYVSVVSTIFNFKGSDPMTIYQTSSQSHIKKEFPNAVPQAKFHYTLSPMSVVISQDYVPLYEFITQLFAIVGGTYTFISLTHGVFDSVTKKYKTTIGKLG